MSGPATLSVHTRRQLGYAAGYLELGLPAEAEEALGEIRGGDRDATPVLVLRLAALTGCERWAEAAGIGATLCDREPSESAFWIQWAYAVRRSAGIAEARAILLRGVGLHPREAVFHFNLACYEARLGNLDEARTFLDIACGLETEFIELAKTDPDLEPLRAG